VRLFRTKIGQQREVKLDDGSVATLNTDTQIAVNFNKQQRIIHLLHGEAHFKVFKDAARPLKVLVSGKSVQAVGTAFSVRKNKGTEIEVAVDHGLVTVYQLSAYSQQKSSPALKASLDAGDVLIIADEEPSLIEYDLEQMEDRLAWREGMIVINDETLDYVINEFGRYSEQKVLLADRKMGEIRVAGYFRLGDIDALLVALEKNFKIRSEYYQKNKTFVLSQISQPTL
jgi:transmembrane sensor